MSAEGLERLKAEHAELTGAKRPEVIGRIKAAKELGDLKENADYTSAREEQSFLEGRIAAIEATLRVATVIETPAAAADRVTLGSTVTVEDETGARDDVRRRRLGRGGPGRRPDLERVAGRPGADRAVARATTSRWPRRAARSATGSSSWRWERRRRPASAAVRRPGGDPGRGPARRTTTPAAIRTIGPRSELRNGGRTGRSRPRRRARTRRTGRVPCRASGGRS